MAGKSALLIGATGATGKHILQELIKSEEFTRVGEYGRRATPKEKLGAGASKVEQKVIDFEKLDEAGLKEGKWDVVFITYVLLSPQAMTIIRPKGPLFIIPAPHIIIVSERGERMQGVTRCSKRLIGSKISQFLICVASSLRYSQDTL